MNWTTPKRPSAPGRARGSESSTPALVAFKLTANDPVRRWRLEQLERAGYPTYDALVLSGRNDVDIHTASDLVANGCSVRTALQILL